ncbi:MAG TPA: pitrilysin family protein [Gemmatimonadaceae bacterium]|nr:pitrilysin family protein [Gemmatimonadaceae bacterium]
MLKPRFALLVAGVLAAASVSPVLAQQQQAKEKPPAPGPAKNFVVPPATHFTLPNGMQVTLVPYGQVPKVDVELVVYGGHAAEHADQVWLSDLTGDMMQEGTTTKTAQQVNDAVATMGGSLDLNTGADATYIGADVLSESGPALVALIADVARHPRFPASELARLKADRVRQLTIALSQPQNMATARFRAVLYPNHPYGRLYPTQQMLEGYTLEQIRAFYDSSFDAARAHLYVAGRFDSAAMERAIRTAFGGWTAGAPISLPVPHPVDVRSLHVIDRPGAVQSTIYMGLPVIDPSNPDWVAMQVTNALLGGSFASRITENIREQKGYTYSPISIVSTRYRDAYWAEIADVTTNVTGPSLKEIFGEIDRLRSTAPSVDELRGIQNYMSGIFILQNSSRAALVNQLEFVDLHGLGRQYLADYVHRVYAVTPQDVQRITQQDIDPQRMTIVVAGDRSKIDPQLAAYGAIEP